LPRCTPALSLPHRSTTTNAARPKRRSATDGIASLTGIAPATAAGLVRLATPGTTGSFLTLPPTPAGMSVTIGGMRSPTYVLPTNRFIGNDAVCYVNPYCDTL